MIWLFPNVLFFPFSKHPSIEMTVLKLHLIISHQFLSTPHTAKLLLTNSIANFTHEPCIFLLDKLKAL